MLSETALIATASLAGLLILALAALRGWHGWLSLKQRELDLRLAPREVEPGSREGAQRIELADLKERIRKLEAIASGVDL